DRALEGAEAEDRREAPAQAGLDPAAPQEPEEREQEDCPDHAAEQSVRPLPPEDGLELAERHAAIEQLVLRDRFVLVELGLPRGLRQRRDRAADRLPLGDRKAGLGEPRRAAD